MSDTFEQQAGNDVGQTVVVNIDQYLHEGMSVFDRAGERVGEVRQYSTAAGYLLVRERPLDKTYLYIPFRLIWSADPREIYVNETKDTITASYSQPPAISTVSETRLVPGPHGDMTPQTYQVQMVQSGYDAKQVTFTAVDTSQIGQQLVIGMAVYDVAGARAGARSHGTAGMKELRPA